MKRWLFFLLLGVALAPGFISAQDTAYKALRAVGAQRGEKALNHVVAIVGKSGRPQPVAWQVVLDDPAARGGDRELDIVAGQVSSERTPVRPPASGSTPINLTKLNLDSDGAFRTAENEASRNQVGFDSVNYRLTVDGASGQPVWVVEMFDYEQRPVGTVRVAAGNGTLLSAGNWVPETRDARGQSARQYSDSEALAGSPPTSNANPPPQYQDRKYSSSGNDDSDDHSGETVGQRANRYGASVMRFGSKVVHKTTRAFQTVGGWFQEKFTGQNTINPNHGQDDQEDEEETPSDRYSRPAPSHDQYSQPVTPPPE